MKALVFLLLATVFSFGCSLFDPSSPDPDIPETAQCPYPCFCPTCRGGEDPEIKM